MGRKSFMAMLIDKIRQAIRRAMRQVARGLRALSGGRITPNQVTYAGLLLHLPVAYLIITGHGVFAALGLIIFGLLDTLDGELARLTHRSSDAGGLLDATTDRLKEVILYSAVAYLLVRTAIPAIFVAATVVACGASICVSFVKSKGETITATHDQSGRSYAELNRLFGGGLFPFEVRMVSLAVGLLFGTPVLQWIVVAIALLSTITVFQRLSRIMKAIS